MKKIRFFMLLLSTIVGVEAFAGTSFVTRTYNLRDFTILEVNNIVKVVYTQGETYSVKLTGRKDLLDKMEVNATGGRLSVRAKKTKVLDNLKQKDKPDGQHNFILQLTAPCLKNILLYGVSTFQTTSMTSDYMQVSLNGVSKFKAEGVDCPTFSVSVEGCSELRLGKALCKRFDAKVKGSSKVEIQHVTTGSAYTELSGASKLSMSAFYVKEKASMSANGASKLTLSVADCKSLDIGFAGASKGDVTFKGEALRAACTGASKLEARLDCQGVKANCDGASRINFSGTADKVEVERGGVATNIDTSRLNQF